MADIVANLIQLHPFRIQGISVEHLLLRRSPNEPLSPGVWQVITGSVEPGERSFEAAQRELLEETGLRAGWWLPLAEPASFFYEPEDRIYLSPVFLCRIESDALPILSKEHDEYRWASLESVCEVLPYPSHRRGAVTVDAIVRAEFGLPPA